MKYGTSFVSAGIDFPAKLLANRRVLEILGRRELKPVHIQLNPTNRCNLNCKFCSCRAVDRNIELPLEDIAKLCAKLRGPLKAVTVTGGGEPLMHREFEGLVKLLSTWSLDMGMATNGLLLKNYKPDLFNQFTWIRISLSDQSKLTTGVGAIAEEYIAKAPQCDWAFSYVCSKNSVIDSMTIGEFLKKFNDRITHFRVVGDILDLDDRVAKVHEIIVRERPEVPLDKTIFQSRTQFTRGSPQCRIAILKPVITAAGRIQACCGTQYAIKKDDKLRKYNRETDMGPIEATDEIFSRPYFNGSICDVCYYNSYNEALSKFFTDVDHENFV